ncbi:site-specific DNA-methyltransferase [Pseudomonas aeruginosa]|uniref:site-specific DNA-methyltransferase n=1 Tax=Pseudomonas aeruginosa TaxID=287 RepID=UPI0021AEC875|nr:site-specific DNA-methyltransferase [Pseudomonas aeruginosa]MCT5252109.1 site-specific DNA-methyltransferase [Pseudomonas aeruginosa]MDV8134136.1 site-specific DNA-methyltransferase [Pseudomonas aeruginosa]
MDKLKMHSPDLSQENIAKIRELFSGCVIEARDEKTGKLRLAVDFDLLRQELSDHLVEGPQERYRLEWPGKREALLAANAPIAKTLRPCREESVDFDSTKNLFIEGDNLEALKLLQETYLGKVKMIYLDPPYNRKKGNNLVYRDDFIGNTYDYLTQSNQSDEQGNRLVSNSEANGRFHSDWLSMMYQRLRVARNLLTPAGVIAISIDDAETANVLHLCYEVFGESNFLGTLIWKNATDNNPSNIAVEHESIHVFARSKNDLEGVWKSSVSDVKEVLIGIGEELIAKHSNADDLQAAYTEWFRENKAQLGPLDRYKYIDSGGVYTGSQSVHNPGKEGYRYDVPHPRTGKPCKEPLMGYRFPKETMNRLLSEERILFGEDESKIIELKVYASEFEDKLSSVFELDGRTGPYDLKSLFPEGKKVFSNPKPVLLMERLISFMTGHQDICLDLFAGSSTLAHATMEINRREGGNRRFISVQYPEPIGQDSKDAKEAYQFCAQVGLRPFISEISKERTRRAGAAVRQKDGAEQWNRDTGFRLLKIDTSNMKDVYYRPDQLSQADLFESVDNVKIDRTAEDLLFQVLVDWGVDLALPIRRETTQGKTVFFVDDNALVACFDQGISEELVKELAKGEPLRVVFRDSGFVSDALKINVEQIFRQLSPTTEVKAI